MLRASIALDQNVVECKPLVVANLDHPRQTGTRLDINIMLTH